MITSHSEVTLPATARPNYPAMAAVDDLAAQESNLFIIEAVVTNGATPPKSARIEVYALSTGEAIADDATALQLLTTGQIAGARALVVFTHPSGSGKRIQLSDPIHLYNVPGGTSNLVVYVKLGNALTQDVTLTVRVAPYN